MQQAKEKQQLTITAANLCESTHPQANAVKLIKFFCEHNSFLEREFQADKKKYNRICSEWAKHIEGLNKGQLRNGCKWYLGQKDKALPNVIFFKRKCLGLPDSLMAFEMAKEDRYMHPAIYAAASKISDRDWKEEKHNLRSRFLMWYDQVCESIMGGATIDMPDKPDALDDNSFIPKYRKRTPEETERGKLEIEKLRQTIANASAKKAARGQRLD